ncbi:hypothetical protein RFI_19486 [Reticulomyxa filosa]|uniref:DSBA-like thioredoxin domain-containing protein n=1 Tax=Reticulomyxa filosa TaxID=46433 RepID=X6MW18_RETFI|nr:hypothetical protein RFI_19486 [Reticulomyxa filosa]|eukprot:ETO17826.1 hypothetical protein RFI_19486 [Reticulomyxa filosa]
MLPHMKTVGLQCSPEIKFSYGGKIGNTLNSHRLVTYSKQFNKSNECVELLMKYYFEMEKDISDINVLVEIGDKLNLPKVKAALESKELCEEVNKELKHSRDSLGVSSVPTFFINEKARISGGQRPLAFLEQFAKLRIPLLTERIEKEAKKLE